MILLGCLLALGLAVAPRAVLVLAWIFSDRWPIVWGGDWIVALLGIVFVPYTTVMYMLVWSPSGIEGWDWLWIALGLFLDASHWSQSYLNRNKVPGYATATAAVSGAGPTATPPPAAAPVAAPPVAAPPVAAPPVAAPPVAAPQVEPPPAAPPVAGPPVAGPPPEEGPPGTGPSGA
jgi:hypothetical protein